MQRFAHLTRNFTEAEVDELLKTLHDRDFNVDELPHCVSQWKVVKKYLLRTLKHDDWEIEYVPKGSKVRKIQRCMLTIHRPERRATAPLQQFDH